MSYRRRRLNVSWRIPWRDLEAGGRKVKSVAAVDAKTQGTRVAAAVRRYKSQAGRLSSDDFADG